MPCLHRAKGFESASGAQHRCCPRCDKLPGVTAIYPAPAYVLAQRVARGRIAVQVDAARRPQHAPQFHKARSHHREIREHVALAEERPKRLHRL
jgi:hypothetical protein